MKYQIALPGKIQFGWGIREALPSILSAAIGPGAQVWLVHGSQTLKANPLFLGLLQSLHSAGITVRNLCQVTHEPTVDSVDQTCGVFRSQGGSAEDILWAIGGGSAMDMAKAVAGMALAPAGSSVLPFLEGTPNKRRLEWSPLRWLAMPTTGGTGSEATKNAVISRPHPPSKKSFRDDRLFAWHVLVDPELSCQVSPTVTAASGMDALTQLIECFTTQYANPFTGPLVLDALARLPERLLTAFQDGHNRLAREALAHAALVSGMALANSGLGLAHGVAAALGALCGLPHGLACAVMLPVAISVNREVCAPQYEELADVLAMIGPPNSGGAKRLITGIYDLLRKLRLPVNLCQAGVPKEMLPAIAAGSFGNSMGGNPRQLSEPELLSILESSWDHRLP